MKLSEGYMEIPLETLLEYWDPTLDDVWGCGRILEEDVLAAANELNRTDRPADLKSEHFSSYDFNVARIAYLLYNGWDAPDVDLHPVTVDIGVSGYTPEELVTDGNHRLAAAKFRGDKTIAVEVSGDLEKSRKVFLEGLYIDDV